MTECSFTISSFLFIHNQQPFVKKHRKSNTTTNTFTKQQKIQMEKCLGFFNLMNSPMDN